MEKKTHRQHIDVQTNGITLHTVQAGPKEGPLLIFLHGFPEFWYCWHRQIDFFAGKGFRVIVPDQRGYNTSSKLSGISPYRIDSIARDTIGLIEYANRRKACIVGHDWGGATAWWLGQRYSSWVEKLAVLNCPHPSVITEHLLNNPAQRKKSWYIFYYQLPWLPELTMSREKWAFSRKALQFTSVRGTFSKEEIAEYVKAWSKPGALTAMLNWYRAGLLMMKPSRQKRHALRKIEVVTLLLWGVKDHFLGQELAQPSIDRCSDGKLVFLEEATHWLQHEVPERVNSLLLDFLS